jgi:hypothetical protein
VSPVEKTGGVGVGYEKRGAMNMKKNHVRIVFLAVLFLGVMIIGILGGVSKATAALTLDSASATNTQLSISFNETVVTGTAVGALGNTDTVWLTDPTQNPQDADYHTKYSLGFNYLGNPDFVATVVPNLDSSIIYTLHILNLQAQNGDSLTTNKSFKPGAPTGLSVFSTVPTDGATGVDPNIQPSVTFSEAVTLASIKSAFTVSTSQGAVSGTVSLDSSGTVAAFTPSQTFDSETTFTATVKAGVQATNGDTLASDTTWSFTTGSESFQNSGTKCFIATAAYGSYLEPHVVILRAFRDKYLLTNAPGRAFVRFYYKHSPPLADFIARHESLKMITRWALTPLVYGAEYPVSIVFFLVFGIVFVGWRKRH